MRILITVVLGCAVFGCGSNSTDSLLLEARRLDSLERYNEAIAIYDKVLSLDSTNFNALYDRGTDKGLIGDRKGQIDDLSRILKSDSTNTSVLVDLGITFGNMGKYQEAIKAFDDAIETKGGEVISMDLVTNHFMPDNAKNDVPFIEIKLERGIVYYKTDSVRKAYQDLTYCIENGQSLSNDKLRDSHYYRGRTYLKAERLKEACEDLKWSELKGMKEAKKLLDKYCR